MIANRKVLVLNKSWQPVSVVTLEKALSKLLATYSDGTPKAKIIDAVHDFANYTWEDWSKLKPSENELKIRTVTAVFRVPEIIQYTKYNRPPMHRVSYNRRTIYRRDNYTCQYCGKSKNTNEISLDHVIPRCQGGLTCWENIVVACTDCNSRKAGRTPEQARMKLLKKPIRPKYNFLIEDIRVDSWQTFIGEAYWNCELENDMD